MMRSLRSGACIAAALVAGLAAGCTADPVGLPPRPQVPDGVPVGAPGVQLVAFDSCDSALRELKEAALEQVGPYGLPGDGSIAAREEGTAAVPGAAQRDSAAEAPAQQLHSTTNVHESGADEPDLVKTDGKRIVSVLDDGRLRVVDVATRKVTAEVGLDDAYPTGLFLHGDRALVISPGGMAGPVVEDRAKPMPDQYTEQLRLQLVDVSGDGELIDTMSVDGGYVDARATDGVARVVIRSSPRLEFTHPAGVHSEGAATNRNREVIRRSEIADWLPRYSLNSHGNRPPQPLVDCHRISHPKPTTGTSLLTVLTLDLADDLGKGDPVSISANGGTVYGNGEHLYVADDDTTNFVPMRGPISDSPVPPRPPKTRVYQFDVSGDGPPEFLASGAVDGTLLNQYSMSEHEGHLRIATTEQDWNREPDRAPRSESAVVVLKRVGEKLTEVGEVGGLGKGEQIYSVRFLGDLGYVVTFRQTDPLYRIDLSDPANPQVDGELKITGFSSYLHPVGEGRLFGVGQEATTQGQITGMQVSLFDISDAKPARLDRLHIKGAHSDAEHDPHAFLYWPQSDLVVLPMLNYRESDHTQEASALVLRVADGQVERVGSIRHTSDDSYRGAIRRSLVIGDTLWTLSSAGVQANDLDDLGRKAFIRFN